MAKGSTDWDSVETWQKVVSAILATGVKPDLRAVATYYGTTYDTLENRFRKLKKYAAELKEEVDGGHRGEMTATARTKSASSTPRKPKTPKKDPLASVANGRVAKQTPTKKGIKKEHSDNDHSMSFADQEDGGNAEYNVFEGTGLDFDADMFTGGLPSEGEF